MKILIFLICIFLICIISFYSLYYESFETMNVDEKVIKDIQSYPDKSLNIFYNKKFSPNCCPSLYTKSSGCMCDDDENNNLLIMRGGNRLLKDTYVKGEKNPYLLPPACRQCPS